jgi:serine/threonine protein kinase
MGKLNSCIRRLQDILSCVTCRSSEPNVHRTAPAASGGERAATSSAPQLCAGTESTMERTDSGYVTCTEITMERTDSGHVTCTESTMERTESGSFSNTEQAIQSSKRHWISPSEEEEVAEVDNVEVFKNLESHPTWGSFFKTFDEGELVVGEKFADGVQAEIYYADWRMNPADRGKPSIMEEQIELSKAHWTQLAQPDGDEDEDEEAAKKRIKEEEPAKVRNKLVFKELQEKKLGGTFFYEFEEGELVMDAKFAEGAQAELYYAQIKWRNPNSQKLLVRGKDVLEDRNQYVLKVFKKTALLEQVKDTLPQAMLNFQKKRLNAYGTRRYICDVVCATLLEDGRFAFVMQREDTDLRKLIEQKLRAGQGEGGEPFPREVAENFMYEVAKGMEWLHGEGIVHRDLKASNVLVRESHWNYCFVADYECSVGVIGTGFHRAPEILEALKSKASKRPELFTKAADVYAYGMTCYEILTGKLPFEGHNNFDPVLIHKQRPELPEHVDVWIRDLLNRCWRFDPKGRPSFEEILNILRENSIAIQYHEKRAYPMACHWGHPKTEMIPIADLKKVISNQRKQQVQYPEKSEVQVKWRSQFDNEYEPWNEVQCEWILKVFREELSLQDLKLQFPEGMLEFHADRRARTRTGPSPTWEKPRYICDVLCATLLISGRFALVMQREHEDLRTLIDRNMRTNDERGIPPFLMGVALRMMRTKDERGIPPFPMGVALRMMHDVACGMDWLHSYNILHRDLKASNVLVTKDASGNYHCFVADYECSVGVIGTGFWRAPEILQACKDKSIKRQELFSAAGDVYSYGILCYEILTGKLPFEDHRTNDYDLVLNGQRPEVPEYVAGWLRELLRRCWQSDPAARPSFWQIQKLFETAEEDRMERLDEILSVTGFS